MTKQKRGTISQVGRYQVVRLIGRGAMGQVLLAHDPVLERPVALKHLRTDLTLEPDQYQALARRMQQEARASARVSHPHLVAVHDLGDDPIVGAFLVFEYVEGPTLEERIAQGPLDPGEVARLSRQLGAALTAAHAARVLHRDIKPENVLLARTGAKIADFGIARLPDSTLTVPGGLLGTPAYSAPEAIDEGSFSPASDQFSMACTLFEAISGRRAFPGDEAAAVAALVQTTEPAPLARLFRLDARVDTVLARAFAKHPASRFPSCEEFGHALADALEATYRPAMITQPDQFHLALSAPPRRRRGIYATGAACVALVVGVALALEAYDEGPGLRSNPARAVLEARAAAAEKVSDSELHPVAWLPARAGGPAARSAGRAQSVKRSRRTPAALPDAGSGARP